LVAHLEAAPQTQHLVMGILNKSRAETTEADVEKVRDLYLLSGALDNVIDMICEIRDRVLSTELLRKEEPMYALAATLIEMALAPLSGQVASRPRSFAS
jgi:hypothetical protein